ncbi:MAG: hypothetical protein M1834_000282 [Cirrosporium novae-zelandiae]|nr:MAG: hypothetical protein M1834_000282 [Cirrosporium novae-zelandiae]
MPISQDNHANSALIPIQEPDAGQTVASMAGTEAISAGEKLLFTTVKSVSGASKHKKSELRSAKILLITIKALANEVAKNLVLAGIGSLTILDHEVVTEDDLCSQFLISEKDIGINRAQAASTALQNLNPRVKLYVDPSPIANKPPNFVSNFDLVIATELDIETFSTINAACRIAGKPFYCAASHGFYGFIFADLIQHDYVIEREKSNIPTEMKAETVTRSIIGITTKKENNKIIELVTKREIYSPIILANTSPLPLEFVKSRRKRLQVPPLLSCLRALFDFQKLTPTHALPSHTPHDLQTFTKLATEKHGELQLPSETLRSEFLRSFLQNLGSELAPVTAFLGGTLAQDVINVLGGREQPLQNWLFFDGEDAKGPIYALHPIWVEGHPGTGAVV